MVMIKYWLVRKGEDAWKVAPEVADAISKHRHPNQKCLFCRENHLCAAVVTWRDRDHVMTADMCAHCAEHSDEWRKFDGWVATHFSPRH